MAEGMRIVALSGSARRASFNTALLRATAALLARPHALEVRTIAGIPLYDGDLEQERGIPDSVAALKDAIAGADGLVIATPEYNHSLPGPLKNAIDWCSRPTGDIERVFGGRPVALCGATMGTGATALAQAAWLPVLRRLGVRPWTGGQLAVSTAHEAFDEAGAFRDAATRARAERFANGFAAFCAACARAEAAPEAR